eukprot:TRINITY_DN2716_c1_g1_i7.p2 TRINITY_DN2716_c1_g1~~TRINITY_DN2716_c1_g1_i7.p2  ORF type:complete len:373 (+),score=36.62 TRINITY_DN2716_c1_g1_i7:32-1150(+)
MIQGSVRASTWPTSAANRLLLICPVNTPNINPSPFVFLTLRLCTTMSQDKQLETLQQQLALLQQENQSLKTQNQQLADELDSAGQDLEDLQWQNGHQIQELQEKNKRLSEGKEKVCGELSTVQQQLQLLCDLLDCSSVTGLCCAVQQNQNRLYDLQEEMDFVKKELQQKSLAAEAQKSQITELQAQLLRERQEHEYRLEQEKRKFRNDRDKWGEKEYALIEAIQNQSRKLAARNTLKNQSSDASNSTDSYSSLGEGNQKVQVSPSSYAPTPPISPLPAPGGLIHSSSSYLSQQYYQPSPSPQPTYRSGPTTPRHTLFTRHSYNTPSPAPHLNNCHSYSATERGQKNCHNKLSRAAERVRKLQHTASVFAVPN